MLKRKYWPHFLQKYFSKNRKTEFSEIFQNYKNIVSSSKIRNFEKKYGIFGIEQLTLFLDQKQSFGAQIWGLGAQKWGLGAQMPYYKYYVYTKY